MTAMSLFMRRSVRLDALLNGWVGVFGALLLMFLVGCEKGAVEQLPTEPARVPLEAESVWMEHLTRGAGKNPDRTVVQSTKGQVSVSRDERRSWQDAQVEMALEVNWVVRTGNGTVDFDFVGSGLMLRVTENSRLKLVRMDVENTGIEKIGDTMIDLEQGRIEKSLRKRSPAARLMVRTPAGVVTDIGWSSINADGMIR